HVALLQTFADQAVIAIENVRLFTGLQEKNHAVTQAHAQVTESLEQQMATAEILRVIASSPMDLQPVLDAVAESAARLCDSLDAQVFRVEGDTLCLAASFGVIPGLVAGERLHLTRGWVTGCAILDRQTVHVHDLHAEPCQFPESSTLAMRYGHRTMLAVPLLRGNTALGVITMRRAEVRPFSDKEIALLQTFADQAVIAIENVRLFTELEARNRDLTATSEILQVISRSPTDVQPVFETIAESGVRLTNGMLGGTMRFADGLLHLTAVHVPPGERHEGVERFIRSYPVPLDENTLTTQVAREGIVVRVPDTETDPLMPEAQRQGARKLGARSLLILAVLRAGQRVGMIFTARREAIAFSDSQIALLETFAAQAVIAIENVRLFKELEARTQELSRSVEQLTALGDVGHA